MLEVKNKDLNEKLIDARKGLLETGSALLKVQQVTEQLMNKREQKDIQLQRAMELHKQYEIRIADLETKLSLTEDGVKLHATVSSYRKIIGDKDDIIMGLEKENADLKANFSKAKKEYILSDQKLAEQMHEVESLQHKVSSLESIIQKQEAARAELEFKKEQAVAATSAANKTIQSMEAEYAARISAANKTIHNMEAEHAANIAAAIASAIANQTPAPVVQDPVDLNLLLSELQASKANDIETIEKKFSSFEVERKTLEDRMMNLELQLKQQSPEKPPAVIEVGVEAQTEFSDIGSQKEPSVYIEGPPIHQGATVGRGLGWGQNGFEKNNYPPSMIQNTYGGLGPQNSFSSNHSFQPYYGQPVLVEFGRDLGVGSEETSFGGGAQQVMRPYYPDNRAYERDRIRENSGYSHNDRAPRNSGPDTYGEYDEDLNSIQSVNSKGRGRNAGTLSRNDRGHMRNDMESSFQRQSQSPVRNRQGRFNYEEENDDDDNSMNRRQAEADWDDRNGYESRNKRGTQRNSKTRGGDDYDESPSGRKYPPDSVMEKPGRYDSRNKIDDEREVSSVSSKSKQALKQKLKMESKAIMESAAEEAAAVVKAAAAAIAAAAASAAKAASGGGGKTTKGKKSRKPSEEDSEEDQRRRQNRFEVEDEELTGSEEDIPKNRKESVRAKITRETSKSLDEVKQSASRRKQKAEEEQEEEQEEVEEDRVKVAKVPSKKVSKKLAKSDDEKEEADDDDDIVPLKAAPKKKGTEVSTAADEGSRVTKSKNPFQKQKASVEEADDDEVVEPAKLKNKRLTQATLAAKKIEQDLDDEVEEDSKVVETKTKEKKVSKQPLPAKKDQQDLDDEEEEVETKPKEKKGARQPVNDENPSVPQATSASREKQKEVVEVESPRVETKKKDNSLAVVFVEPVSAPGTSTAAVPDSNKSVSAQSAAPKPSTAPVPTQSAALKPSTAPAAINGPVTAPIYINYQAIDSSKEVATLPDSAPGSDSERPDSSSSRGRPGDRMARPLTSEKRISRPSSVRRTVNSPIATSRILKAPNGTNDEANPSVSVPEAVLIEPELDLKSIPNISGEWV